MSQRVELFLVRHGESIRNQAANLAHHGDTALLEWQMKEQQDEAVWPLTEHGSEQAALAGQWIRDHATGDFDAAYVSPYLRANQTAEGLGLHLNWQVDDRLREREWGDYTAPGFPPYTVSQYLSDLAQCSDLSWKTIYPGSESVLDMVPRVKGFLYDALRGHPGGRMIAVTHGGTIRAIQTVLEELSLPWALGPDHRLSNCCVVMYRLDHLDLERGHWQGEVRTAHPALEGDPETPWQPIGRVPDIQPSNLASPNLTS